MHCDVNNIFSQDLHRPNLSYIIIIHTNYHVHFPGGDWFWSAVAYKMVNEASSSSLTCAFTRYHCSIQSMQTAAANCPTVLVCTRPSKKQRSSPESGKGLAQAPSHCK